MNYNFRNDVSAQQQIRVQHENHNISIVQGQNSTGTQVQSQANVNAQRIQTSYNATQQSTEIKYNPFIAYSTETTVTNIPDRDDPFNNASRIRMNAPPIPPLPKKNFANNILNEVPTSSTHEKLPAPLVPVKKQEASGSLSKSPSIILKEVPTSSTHVKLHTPLGLVQKQEQFKLHPTESVSHRKVSLNSVNDFLTLKASIRDVKDPNFLQFHKELNKTKPLSDVRLSLINNQHLSDVTLIVGDNEETIYAHKMFLITASSLFLTQFEGKNEVYMILDKIEPVILLEVLKYCYTNQVNITEQNVLDLLKAADYLKVRQLSNVCHLFITNLFNENSIFMIFEKALEQKNELFEKKCINYMLKNEEKCFSSKGFYKIGFSSLLDIVGKCKFSNDKNEEIIKKWNYGEENMVFTASESKIMPKPNDSSAKSKGKQRNNPGKASTSDTFGSVKDLASNHNQTEDFVFHDDDNESIISKDDDIEMKTQLWFNGPKKQIVSEFRYVYSCYV